MCLQDARGNDVKWQLIGAKCPCVLAVESITRNCFSLQTLETFKSSWDSFVRPLAMERFPQKKMRLWNPLNKLSEGHGVPPIGTSQAWAIDSDWTTQNWYSAPSSLCPSRKTLGSQILFASWEIDSFKEKRRALLSSEVTSGTSCLL